MRITISGSPGSGTTTLGKALAEKYGLRYVSAGEFFRACAKDRCLDLAAFGELAKKDPAIDKEVDERQKEFAKTNDNIILEGRLAGWMVEEADLKILLWASQRCRSARIAEREKCEADRYRAYYDIDITDQTPYHLVLSSERFNQEQVLSIVSAAVDQL